MSEQRAMFSESWHRVAGQRLRLRPSVEIRRQTYRGERWFVARDEFTLAYFRFRPEAYDFIARLDGTRTVEEVWMGCLERSPDTTPGQGEVVAMLAQLYQANLLAADTAADTARLFERHKERKRQELASQLFGIFYLRMRLFDPDPLLRRTWPWMRWLATPLAAVAWVVVVGLGLAAVFSHWDRAVDQSQGVLAPGNLLLLYAAFALAKLIHEFGHAYSVKAFGGEVHAMGITLLVFTPVPYVDATAAWSFRERWKRVIVGLGGMIPELFYAGIAAMIWAGTGPGTLNSLAYNTMIVASVSTVIFNINPLLRFDGYYILSDLADSPNLQPRASRHWLFLLERFGFGVRKLDTPARSRAEGWWLAIYGVASFIYRIFITVSIILVVADRYFGLGLLAGVLTFLGAFIIPVVKSVKYLAAEPRLERGRRRAWAVSLGALAVAVVFLGFVPLPHHFRAPAIVRAAGSRDLYVPVDGWVDKTQAQSGARVTDRETVLDLVSPELDFTLAAARADLTQAEGRERQMLSDFPAGIEPMKLRIEASKARIAQLEGDRTALDVRAPVEGLWVASNDEDWEGLWLRKGTRLGEIVGRGPDWEIQAVVSQDNASQLFGAAKDGAEVRFVGSGGDVLAVAEWRVVPGRQEMLPSAALGWAARGPVKVVSDDKYGVKAAEPFFLVIGRIPGGMVPAGDGPRLLWQGRTAVMRFDLPWRPLLVQWARAFRQLLQERYQI